MFYTDHVYLMWDFIFSAAQQMLFSGDALNQTWSRQCSIHIGAFSKMEKENHPSPISNYPACPLKICNSTISAQSVGEIVLLLLDLIN